MAKQKVCDKDVAIRVDGKLTEVPENEVPTTVTFAFVASKNVLDLDLVDLPGVVAIDGGYQITGELPVRLLVHGIHQKVGDSYSSLGDQPDDAEEAAMSILEQLKGGNWNAKREAGEARPSLVGRAVFEFKTTKNLIAEGEDVDFYIKKYSGKDAAALRAKALKSPDVAAIVARIKAEEATARATKLAEKAAAAGASPAPATDASAL